MSFRCESAQLESLLKQRVAKQQRKSTMGKFNKINKKKRATALEIVPKESQDEVQLPESRSSDDKPLKKVI